MLGESASKFARGTSEHFNPHFFRRYSMDLSQLKGGLLKLDISKTGGFR
jgi:hypothetical protein